jgi:hypothetical protein
VAVLGSTQPWYEALPLSTLTYADVCCRMLTCADVC